MVVVIVTEQHDRDRRQIVEANAGCPDAMRPRKLEWARAVGVHRIGQDAGSVGLDEKGRVANVADGELGALHRRWLPRRDGDRGGPRRAPRGEEPRRLPDRLTIRAVGIEESPPVEVVRARHASRSGGVTAGPVGELRERAAELALQAGDVGAVADALEPLQHQRRILAVLPDLCDGRLREGDRPTQRLRQDLRHLRHRSYVTGDIDLAAVQRGGLGERARAEPADVVHRNHLQLRGWPERPGQLVALETEGGQQVFHEGHRTQDHMRGEAEAAYGFLDAPLVVKVRDARPLVRRSHGRVDVVFDTGLARQRRQTLALRLFPLDARLPRVLHAEDAPRAGQRTAQRRLVIEIALDDVDAVARQRRRRLALRLARHAAQTEPAALERPRDRAALMAGHARDENRAIGRRAHGCTHEAKPRSRRSDSMTQKVVLAVKTSAAASTPVYFSITGAAAASVHASRYPFTPAQAFSPYFWK